MKDVNPSSSTESDAARASEAAGVVGDVVRGSSLVGASRRSGPNLADPAVRKAKWMSDCLEHMGQHWPQAEYRQALAVIVEDAASPAAKSYLERASAERQARMKRRTGACRSAMKMKRAPRAPRRRRA